MASSPASSVCAGSQFLTEWTRHAAGLSGSKLTRTAGMAALFSFVSLVISGGLLTFLWNALRDEEARRQSVLITLRGLTAQLDDQYRAVKRIKRTLRSRATKTQTLFQIKAELFEKGMDEISNIQLKIETLRNSVRDIPDMIGRSRLERITIYLEYTASYLHDVTDQFENGCAKGANQASMKFERIARLYLTFSARGGAHSQMIRQNSIKRGNNSMLASHLLPKDKLSLQRRVLRRGSNSFQCVNRLIKGTKGRTKAISDACMTQAIRDLREEIVTSRPLVSLTFLRRWPSPD